MKEFVKLPKLQKGDTVAILSPSAGLPGLFPWVQDLGLERVREVFGLVPREYPTTRQMGSSFEDRARDLHAAFVDPEVKAIITSIGGHDQIGLLKYLDTALIKKNPKPFFGFSDNTHMCQFLWKLGIPVYYGGAVLTQFAMQGEMHALTVEFLRHALFDAGEFELRVSKEFNDIGLDWADKSSLDKRREFEPNDGLFWDGREAAQGILWGGCVESMVVQMSAAKFLPNDNDLDGTVLFLETAEDIPEHWIFEYVLTGMGERGWLEKFQAVLVGRPKAWEFDKPFSSTERAAYRQAQRELVITTVRKYNKSMPIVQNLDFGHTDPQVPLPMGNKVRIETPDKKIFLTY